MRARSYLWLAAINAVFAYAYVLWSRLAHYAMEGYVPLALLAAGFSAAVVAPIVVNLWRASRAGRYWWQALATAAVCWLILFLDPLVMPHYRSWANQEAMMLAMRILAHFNPNL
ncbi:hypothetical protein [Paenibacillus methanolicus]|uniref:Uncharacterized protein n=1 Tax=Paenibacillus methanolicus TaxID=582686 RepID=A0A5S5BVD3_9BACL|nr:hypothetical protein [Paenibacillus methanolicus]TYP69563.1 hypothetical protein BCM02_11479 [Paenibacillus methanolicus]